MESSAPTWYSSWTIPPSDGTPKAAQFRKTALSRMALSGSNTPGSVCGAVVKVVPFYANGGQWSAGSPSWQGKGGCLVSPSA